MVSARLVTAFVLAASVGFVIANCGGSSDSSSSSGVFSCPMNDQQSKCTAEQNKMYSDCLISKCDAQFQACYGSGYKSGSFSGACGPYLTCISKCGCTDMACKSACTITPDCQTCITGMLAGCALSSGCTLPVCTGTGTGGTAGAGTGGTAGAGTGGAGGAGTGGAGGSGGGGTGCAALSTCCAAFADAGAKMACQQALAEFQMLGAQGDQACTQAVSLYRQMHLCP
jgi:hypothetical protein